MEILFSMEVFSRMMKRSALADYVQVRVESSGGGVLARTGSVVAGAGGHVLPERGAAVPSLAVPPAVQEVMLDRDALLLQRGVHRQQRVGGQGMTFANWRVNAPVCAPSRATILSGRYYHNIGPPRDPGQCMHVNTGNVASPETGLFGLLTRGGYHTGVFGKVTKGLDVVKAIERVGSKEGKTARTVLINDCGQIA